MRFAFRFPTKSIALLKNWAINEKAKHTVIIENKHLGRLKQNYWLHILQTSTILLSKTELYIIWSILGEIYACVWVDVEQFATIHSIEEVEILRLKYVIYYIYEKLVKLKIDI